MSTRTYELTVPVRKGERGMGIVVNPENCVIELAADGPAMADGRLHVGDVVVAVDGEDTAALDHDEIATYLKSLMAAPRSLTIARPAEHALPGGVGDMIEQERGEVELEREARAADARAAADGNFIPARTYVRPGGAPAPSANRRAGARDEERVALPPRTAYQSAEAHFVAELGRHAASTRDGAEWW